MGFDAVHAWAIEVMRGIVPRLESTTSRWQCIDDATGKTVDLDQWHGVDRGFDVALIADSMPEPDDDEDIQACCSDCVHMRAHLGIRRRYQATGDQAARTKRIGVDSGQIAAAFSDPAAWPDGVYDVEVSAGPAPRSIRRPAAVAAGPFADVPTAGDADVVALIITTRVTVYYTEEA